jgi:hypothetical protein
MGEKHTKANNSLKVFFLRLIKKSWRGGQPKSVKQNPPFEGSLIRHQFTEIAKMAFLASCEIRRRG